MKSIQIKHVFLVETHTQQRAHWLWRIFLTIMVKSSALFQHCDHAKIFYCECGKAEQTAADKELSKGECTLLIKGGQCPVIRPIKSPNNLQFYRNHTNRREREIKPPVDRAPQEEPFNVLLLRDEIKSSGKNSILN